MPDQPDWHYLAWVELGAYVAIAADEGRTLDAAELLAYMREIHERHGLPPENAPRRAGQSS